MCTREYNWDIAKKDEDELLKRLNSLKGVKQNIKDMNSENEDKSIVEMTGRNLEKLLEIRGGEKVREKKLRRPYNTPMSKLKY